MMIMIGWGPGQIDDKLNGSGSFKSSTQLTNYTTDTTSHKLSLYLP